MRVSAVLGVVLLVGFAAAARADSFQLSTSSTVTINLHSPNDNFWGEYRTDGNRWGSTSSVYVSTGRFLAYYVTLPSFSFTLPTGSNITSATMSIDSPQTTLYGSADGWVEQTFHPYNYDPGYTSIEPTFSGGSAYITGTSFIDGGYDYPGPYEGGPPFVGSPAFSGNEISTGIQSLDLVTGGEGMRVYVQHQGFNWDGYIDASGQVVVPYTVVIDGTYTSTDLSADPPADPPASTTVPEPSSLALFAVALLALGGAGIQSRQDRGDSSVQLQ